MLLSLLLTNTPRLALAVKYLILTFVFLIEVVYIALLGNDFWFCEPEQVGWLKAILFTLVTLGWFLWNLICSSAYWLK